MAATQVRSSSVSFKAPAVTGRIRNDRWEGDRFAAGEPWWADVEVRVLDLELGRARCPVSSHSWASAAVSDREPLRRGAGQVRPCITPANRASWRPPGRLAQGCRGLVVDYSSGDQDRHSVSRSARRFFAATSMNIPDNRTAKRSEGPRSTYSGCATTKRLSISRPDRPTGHAANTWRSASAHIWRAAIVTSARPRDRRERAATAGSDGRSRESS